MKKGQPCPPEILQNCPVARLEGACYEDRHHVYWPASDYNGNIEKDFRQLEVNKVVVCRWLHNTVHALALPPEKPSLLVMQRSINYERQKRQAS